MTTGFKWIQGNNSISVLSTEIIWRDNFKIHKTDSTDKEMHKLLEPRNKYLVNKYLVALYMSYIYAHTHTPMYVYI